MASESEVVTVFRSAETDAESEAAQVCERLAAAGLDAEVAGDDVPGVIAGSFEVRVPAEQANDAERVLAAPAPAVAADPGHGLDMVAVFRSQSNTAEMEALGVRAVLDASGIPSVMVGSSSIPSLPFEVHVPKSLLEEAKTALAEAEAAGPEAAEQAATSAP